MMKNFRGHRRCTHRVVSEHRGGQDVWYDDPKKKIKKDGDGVARRSSDLKKTITES
jgi:hypothetical protein